MARLWIVERRLALAAMLVMVFAGLPTLTGHVRAVLAATVAADEVTASADAQASGTQVEALADRTDYSQVFANPDGSFTYSAAATAQRVQLTDGSWSSIDTTLKVQADGTIAPAASAAGLVLSGGGSGPLLTLTSGSRSMSLTWPDGALPAPVLSGSTATYQSVLPGVDLVVLATEDGVSEELVINSAQAASNPALSSIAFGFASSGLSVSADADGGFTASDPISGATVFDAPAAQIFDSSGGDTALGSPGATANQATMPVALTSTSSGATASTAGASTTMSVTSDATVLNGSSTVFPVHMCPFCQERTRQLGSGAWREVAWSTAGEDFGFSHPFPTRAGVWCEPDNKGQCVSGATRGKVRTYMTFAVPPAIWDADQATISASMFTFETYAWSCNPVEVDLYRTDLSSRSVIWSTQPARHELNGRATVAHGWNGLNSTCLNGAGVSFKATPAAKLAASGHWQTLTFELQATDADEASLNQFSFKRFDASQSILQVVYDHAPNRPGDTATLDGTRSLGCTSTPTWVTTTAPSFQARISDPDATNVRANFQYTRTGGTPNVLAPTPYKGNNTLFTVQVSGLTDGSYTWDVWGFDGGLSGPRSAACSFGVDTSRPATPTITSDIYQNGVATNPVGKVGKFTFQDPSNKDPADGTNDVVGYVYGFTNPPFLGNFVAAGTDTARSATVSISPVTYPAQTLFVQAVDRAGNLSADSSSSPPAEFAIVTVRPTDNPTLAWWRLNEGSGSKTADASGNGHGVTLTSQAGWGSGRTSGGTSEPSDLRLTGASGSEADTAAQLPPLDNSGSFTVSAWVKLSPPQACRSDLTSCGVYDAVTMDGVHADAFSLEYIDKNYCGTNGCWAFTMPTQDISSWTLTSNVVETTTAVAFDTWVDLVGVYDQTHQQMLLYVNGSQVGATAPGTVQPWAAGGMGSLRMGRTLFADGAWGWWPGEISDVCTFWGALDARQVNNIMTNGCGSAGPA